MASAKARKRWNGERDIDLVIQRWALKNKQNIKVGERPGEEREGQTPHSPLYLTLKVLDLKWEGGSRGRGYTYTYTYGSQKAMAPRSSILAWKIHGQRSLVGCSPWGR